MAEPHFTTIDGVVYDITALLENHPGGSDILMLASGRDATILFHSYHRRFDIATALLKKTPRVEGPRAVALTAAHLARDPNSRTLPALETPLLLAIRSRVNALFPAGRSSRGGAFMIGKSIFLIALTAVFWYLSVVCGYFALAPFLGVLLAMNGLAVQHDCNHGAMSNSVGELRIRLDRSGVPRQLHFPAPVLQCSTAYWAGWTTSSAARHSCGATSTTSHIMRIPTTRTVRGTRAGGTTTGARVRTACSLRLSPQSTPTRTASTPSRASTPSSSASRTTRGSGCTAPCFSTRSSASSTRWGTCTRSHAPPTST